MSQLVISREFLAQFPELPKSVQRRVPDVLKRFSSDPEGWRRLEKPKAAADSRVRTMRIDRFWRGVVFAPDSGDTYVLTAVLPHGLAYDWCERNVFSVNPATGAFEIQDVQAIRRVAEIVAVVHSGNRLLASFSDSDLVHVGIPVSLLPSVRTLETEEQLEDLASLLPTHQGDALRMLAVGYSPEQAYAELVAGQEPGPVDISDVAAAIERPASTAAVYVVQDPYDLVDVLNRALSNKDRILRSLQDLGPMTDGELRKHTGIEPHQQVNQICRRLEAQGALRRERGTDRLIRNIFVASTSGTSGRGEN